MTVTFKMVEIVPFRRLEKPTGSFCNTKDRYPETADMALADDRRTAILTLTVLAAFADGRKSDEERAQVKAVAENLSADAGELPKIMQDVLLGKVDLATTAAQLQEPAEKSLAYEMAVVVCDADGKTNEAEATFLAELRRALGLDVSETDEVLYQAEEVAEVEPDAGVDPADPLTGAAAAGGLAGTFDPATDPLADTTPIPAGDGPSDDQLARQAIDKEVDAMILKYAILNGALELLPQNLATLAILPLQTKMVYRIGQRYGHSLDRRSIGEFIATLGMGATSQMLENVARKFLGKWAKKIGGGMAKKATSAATGAAFSFGSTYGIGQTAKLYYASGRKLSLTDLKSKCAELVGQGQSMYAEYRPQVEQQATQVDTQQILAMVRGG
ncbi:YcjF family protein [Mucisphaera sp.]|uniref:YcjF family protein n=1 Tax=Mucisphaera sp. TaxID=2913024 RepID=UPI003D098640